MLRSAVSPRTHPNSSHSRCCDDQLNSPCRPTGTFALKQEGCYPPSRRLNQDEMTGRTAAATRSRPIDVTDVSGLPEIT